MDGSKALPALGKRPAAFFSFSLPTLAQTVLEGSEVAQEVYQHTFANGMTLLAERMEHVRSAALNFLVPAGCVYDPPPHVGIASVLSDLIIRGAGSGTAGN